MRKSYALPAVARLEYRPLLRSALGAILAPTLAAVMASLWAGRTLALSAVFPARLLALLAAGTVLILYGLPAHGPHHRFGPANHMTLARGALVVFLAALLVESVDVRVQYFALGAAILAALMDAADGWLARRTGMVSAFGARFDMETDAALVAVLAVLAWQFGKVGAWVLLSGAMRYLYAAAAAFIPLLRHPLPPGYRGKTIAVIQMLALLVAVAPWASPALASVVALIGLACLTLSFALDIVWLVRYAT